MHDTHWIFLKSGKKSISGQSFAFGLPNILITSANCSISVFPCNHSKPLHYFKFSILFTLKLPKITLNSGIRRNISAKTHPTAHISTCVPYLDEPYNSSGARYHRLATYKVLIWFENIFISSACIWVLLRNHSFISHNWDKATAN